MRQANIPARVIGTIGANATMLNLGILVLCLWFVASKQDIPNLLLGALIANSGSALGALGTVLTSTRPNQPNVNVEQAEQVGPNPPPDAPD